MKNSDYRRQMGMDMPIPARDYSSERYTVTRKCVETEKPKPKLTIIGGVILVEENGAFRVPTAEEIEELTGGVACWPDNEEGEL